MTHYCVPIENTRFDVQHPSRWFVAEYDLLTAQDAVQCATLDFPSADITIWAATTHEPSFSELRALRASYDMLPQARKRRA